MDHRNAPLIRHPSERVRSLETTRTCDGLSFRRLNIRRTARGGGGVTRATGQSILPVTSAFIIQVHPQPQPDPSEEIPALLRTLLDKVDDTTFGYDIPTIPQ